MKIVIVGSSFGGLTAALNLRKLLPGKDHELIVIARDRQFVFIPSLPWVAMGRKTIEQISFGLEKPLTQKDIEFVEAIVRRIEPKENKVYTDGEEYTYDYLVVATGHRSANEAVPGLGPFSGHGHSLMSPPEAEELKKAWLKLLDNPGPMVIGCAPGASCIGPAYEYAFEVVHSLKQRKLRPKVPITFITPEPVLGHFGVGGFGKARQFLEGEFEERDIRYITSAAISKITEKQVELTDGQVFESHLSMIMPPLSGVQAILDSPGVGNPKGFIPVDEHFRHRDFDNIYAVGVAVALPPVEQTIVPVNFPKTGHMTEQMATIASHNLASDIRGGKKLTHELSVICIMDMGDKAVYLEADPVRPPRNHIKLKQGKRWLWAKRIFSQYYLWRAKRGLVGHNKWSW